MESAHCEFLPVIKPRVLALFGWAFQKLPADEFLICADNPWVMRREACAGFLAFGPKPTSLLSASR